jgi:hypothetical protein
LLLPAARTPPGNRGTRVTAVWAAHRAPRPCGPRTAHHGRVGRAPRTTAVWAAHRAPRPCGPRTAHHDPATSEALRHAGPSARRHAGLPARRGP